MYIDTLQNIEWTGIFPGEWTNWKLTLHRIELLALSQCGDCLISALGVTGRLGRTAMRRLGPAAERSSCWIWLKRSNSSWNPSPLCIEIDHHCGPPILRVLSKGSNVGSVCINTTRWHSGKIGIIMWRAGIQTHCSCKGTLYLPTTGQIGNTHPVFWGGGGGPRKKKKP